MAAYTTLIFADLIQDSPLTTGGNKPHLMVDSPLALDGKKRPILRGTSLAGVFTSQVKKLLPSSYEALLYPQHKKDVDLTHTPSAIKFSNAHLMDEQAQKTTEFFQHVSINPKTQAAKDNSLFNLEALIQGTKWQFQAEISSAGNNAESFAELEVLAAYLLQQWQTPGQLQIGGGSHHGYGWCRLENIKFVCLSTEHILLWPNALETLTTEQWLEKFSDKQVPIFTPEEILKNFPDKLESLGMQPSLTTVLNGQIKVGKRQDDFGAGYGFNPLSIGGHAQANFLTSQLQNRVLTPANYKFDSDEIDPDLVITVRQNSKGELKPYVPGASIRGVWRAALSRHLTANNPEEAENIIHELFGSTSQAGKLFISDATLANDDWKLLWQHHVAIDEFSGGAYGSSKFDRLSLGEAEFNWQVRIEADTSEEAQTLSTLVEQLINELGNNQLPLGGGVWRGYGQVLWQLEGN